ncbi:MAG TPA: intradiol ring-cleavage dioxygenase [Gemmatimonadales bacterium]|jgi:protocatechuate 3,4-dioxygenase beta subunit|nr:intradiol ring-cleavage dioxygenase [Gemmatimonadales bacterium]
MDRDDELIGLLLTRREALTILGAGGLYWLTGCSSSAASEGSNTSTCVVRPALTQGPYFVDDKLLRSDIRSDPATGTVKAGTLLALTVTLERLSGSSCTPLAGALVDVWHCDGIGVYSDVSDPGFNTVGQKFLRGYQVTDAGGQAAFTTIYPGWYAGRAVHIHFKIRSAAGASSAYEFTSQWFFDDTLTDTVHAQVPYSTRGAGRLRNSGDGIYRRGGAQMILPVAASGAGYSATYNVALQIG